MPIGFNALLKVFVPKGELEGDSVEVIWYLEDVRPLGLKNTDNKIICGVWNRVLRPVVSRCSSPLQRGFVAGRQLAQNPVDIDAAAKVQGYRGIAHLHPSSSYGTSSRPFHRCRIPGCSQCLLRLASPGEPSR